jgi:predicted nucleic acid-binding protein
VTYVVLDTDVVSRLHKRTLPASLLEQLVGTAPCVTIGELEKWAVLRAWGHQRRASLAHWLDGVPRLGYDDEVARVWGRLSGEAVRRGRTRPANDMWNAACGLVEGLPLSTLNVKDYIDFVDHHGLALITPA